MIAAEPTTDLMERRLLAWGAWHNAGGCADGYPSKNVLHPSWSPPGGGTTPTRHAPMRGDVAECVLDGKIRQLSVRLQDALFVVYVRRLTVEAQAQMLQCQPSTVRMRVSEAKRQLSLQ